MSDRTESKIAMANRHVESGLRLIAMQETLVARIEARGGNSKFARGILDSFHRTQAIFEDDLRQLMQAMQ